MGGKDYGCVKNSDCQDGFCQEGACVKPRWNGDPCSPALNNCPKGLTCSSHSYRCVDKLYHLNFEYCSTNVDCTVYDYCDGQGHCRRRFSDGERCNSGMNACEDGLVCVREHRAFLGAKYYCRPKCNAYHFCGSGATCTALGNSDKLGYCLPPASLVKSNWEFLVALAVCAVLFLLAIVKLSKSSRKRTVDKVGTDVESINHYAADQLLYHENGHSSPYVSTDFPGNHRQSTSAPPVYPDFDPSLPSHPPQSELPNYQEIYPDLSNSQRNSHSQSQEKQ